MYLVFVLMMILCHVHLFISISMRICHAKLWQKEISFYENSFKYYIKKYFVRIFINY